MTETLKALCLCAVSLGAWTLLSLLLSRAGEPSLRRTLAVLVALLLPPLNALCDAGGRLGLDTAGPVEPLPRPGPTARCCCAAWGWPLLWPSATWDRAWHLLPTGLALAWRAAGLDW